MMGFIQADQSISFQSMQQKLKDFMQIVGADPAVDSVTGFTGGSRTNSGSMFISLKPLSERQETAQQVITRLRGKLAKEPGPTCSCLPCKISELVAVIPTPPTNLPCWRMIWQHCASGNPKSGRR